MSKHSMRSGSASRPSASCRPSSASTRCWRRRSSFRRSWSSASCALRSASSRIRRLSPRSGDAHLDARAAQLAQRPRRAPRAPSTSRWTMHLRRDRHRVAVVLQEELLGDLADPAAGLVGEIERLAVRQHAVADLEDLRVGVDAVDRDRDRVERADRLVGDALALEQAARRPSGGCAPAPPARTPARRRRPSCAARGRARSGGSGPTGSR